MLRLGGVGEGFDGDFGGDEVLEAFADGVVSAEGDLVGLLRPCRGLTDHLVNTRRGARHACGVGLSGGEGDRCGDV